MPDLDPSESNATGTSHDPSQETRLSPEQLRRLSEVLADDRRKIIDVDAFDETKSGDLGSIGTTSSKALPVVTMPKEDPLASWLRPLWEIAGGPKGREESDGVNALFDHLSQRYSGELELFIEPSPDSHVAAYGLTGNIEQVAIQMRLEASEAQKTPGALALYLERVAAPTVERLLREGNDHERVVDLLLGIALRHRVRVNEELVMLARQLYQHLIVKTTRTAGYYASWAGLGDLLGTDGDRKHVAEAVFYYESALADIAAQSASLENDFLGVIEGAANNMCGVLSRLTEQRDDERSDEVLNRLHQLSGIAAMLLKSGPPNRPHAQDEQSQTMWRNLGLAEPAGQGFRQLQLLANMMHMPSAWRHAGRAAMASDGRALSQHLCMTFLETIAAPARILTGADDDEISQTLFNGGVSLLRFARSDAGGDRKPFIIGRVALNAAGLAWALREIRTPQAFVDALSAKHGLSCAVNMFGAIADSRDAIPEEYGRARTAIERLAAGLTAFQGLINATNRKLAGDFFRLSQSIKQMNLDVSGAVTPTADTVQQLRSDLLESITHLAPWAGDDTAIIARINKTDLPALSAAAASFAHACLVRVSGEQEFPHYLTWLASLLSTIAAEGNDLRGSLQRTLQSVAPSSLVVAGVLKQEEWGALKAQITQPLSQSLDRFLHDMQWDFLI